MTLITTTDELAALCQRLSGEPYVCLDTEFMREKTYWPRLCLVQISGRDGKGFAIDPLSDRLQLDPLLDLLTRTDMLKVLHAARQDLEIFYGLSGRVPVPLFDTQVAAMVCGFGEAASYDRLARKLAGVEIDKSSRFTDWSKRPLTDRQLRYAIADVAHLPKIYDKLERRLRDSGRAAWVSEEVEVLTAPESYVMDPQSAWKRIKTRTVRPRFLSVLRELAAVREIHAQKRDLPRNRVLRDEALLEIAAHETQSLDGLTRIRGVGRRLATGPLGAALLQAVRDGIATPDKDRPHVPPPIQVPRGAGPLVDLLKVLLKMRCEENDVATKLVANASDLERIATEEAPDVAALNGWRRRLFGDDALALKRGDLALTAGAGRIALIKAGPP